MESARLSERVPVGSFYKTNIEAVDDVRSKYFIALWIPAFLLIIVSVGIWQTFTNHAQSSAALHQYRAYLAEVEHLENNTIEPSSAIQPLRRFASRLQSIRSDTNGDYVTNFEKSLAYNQAFNTDLSQLLQGNHSHRSVVRGVLEKATLFYQQRTQHYLKDSQRFIFGGGIAIFLALLYAWLGILKPIGRQSMERALALARAGEFNEDVINTSRVIIIVLESDGKVVLVNHYFQSLLQWPRTQIVGRSILDRLFFSEDHDSVIALLDASDPEQIVEIPILDAIGNTLIVAWTVTTVRDVSGKDLLRVAMGVNVTERTQAQKAQQLTLLRAQSLSERLQDEAQQAAELHTAFLGPQDIQLPGVSGLATSISTSEVGGDYLDCYATRETSVLVLGDVSGHGLAAGSIVAVAKTVINQMRAEGIGHPDQVLRRLNNTILEVAQGLRLMTMICAAIDFRRGRLYLANAGQQFPYLQKPDGTWEMLEIGGLPLGQEINQEMLVSEFDLPLGSRLLLISDGWVEESNPDDEPFGYERLEAALEAFSSFDDQVLRDALLDKLRSFCEKDNFDDDLSLIIVRHDERFDSLENTPSASKQLEVVRLSQDYYTHARISPRISRQHTVLLTDNDWHHLLPQMSRDGVRRVLQSRDTFLTNLGWDALLGAHRDTNDELFTYLGIDTPIQLPITGSSDKDGVLMSLESWFQESQMSDAWMDIAILVADELLENALYAAPRDARGNALYPKGVKRALGEDEYIYLRAARKDNILAMQMSDNWGTLTPSIFLQRLSAHIHGQGLIANQGGGGLYLLWRFSNYLQIRVFPGRETRATLFFDLDHPPREDRYPSFQFLYHSDTCEFNHDKP